MRILFIIDVLDSGGVSTVLRALLNNIDLNKYNIDILVFEEDLQYERTLPSEITIRHVYKKNPAKTNGRWTRYFYGVFRECIPKFFLSKFVIRDRYDVVIDFKGNNLNVLAAAKCRKVFWSHKDFSLESNPIERILQKEYSHTLNGKFKNYIFRKRLQQVDDIICISDYCKKAFSDRWGQETKLSVIHNIIDADIILKKSRENILYHKTETLTFCCMSRISDGKGIERLLDCARELNENGYQYQLNIVGGGDSFDKIKSLYNRMNLNNVVLFGHQENPYPYLRECDLYVCPSETECYCTSLCEAIVIGKPVIMTKVGSVYEILGNSENGVIVDNTRNAIYEGMKMFLDHPEMIARYKQKSIERRNFFNVDIRIKEIERFLANEN